MSSLVINKGELPNGGTGLPFYRDSSFVAMNRGCCYYNNEIYNALVDTLPPFQIWDENITGYNYSLVLINKADSSETLITGVIDEITTFSQVNDKEGNVYGVISYDPKSNIIENTIPCGTYCIRIDFAGDTDGLLTKYSDAFTIRNQVQGVLRWSHSKDFLNSIYYGSGYSNCIVITCLEFARPVIEVIEESETDGFGLECIISRTNKERVSFDILVLESMLKTMYSIPMHDDVILDVYNDQGEVKAKINLNEIEMVDNGDRGDCLHTVTISYTSCITSDDSCCNTEFTVIDG